MATWAAIRFVLVTAVVWTVAHAYLGRRLISASSLPAPRRRRAWALLVVVAILPLCAVWAARALQGTSVADPLSWIGFTLGGFLSVLFVFVAAVDVLRLVRRGVARLRRRLHEPQTLAARMDPSRRQFFADVVNLGVVGSAVGVTGIGVAAAFRLPEVVEVEVPIAGLPAALEGFSIVQLTDVHVGPTIKGDYLASVVELANGLDADVAVVTGDLVDGLVEHLAPQVASLRDLRGRHGTFFVTGNHEYYWNGPHWCAELERLGLTHLPNEHRVIEHGGARVLLAGITDHRAGRYVEAHASDPARAVRDAPPCDVRILLAHQPRSVFAAQRVGFDLQISGHTHGGQYFPMNLLVHLFQPYVAGLHWFRSMWIYVSRGVGYWGPPLRAGSRHELTLLRLVRRSSPG